MEKVEKEVENAPPKGDIEALLEELFESEPAVTASSEVAALYLLKFQRRQLEIQATRRMKSWRTRAW